MATMAGRYYSPFVLRLQPQLSPPPQLKPVGRGGRGRQSLRVAASAAGGAADPVKAATDAEFFQPSDTRPIMLFYGVCNLCNGGVRFVRERDPGRSIRYIPLQSESGRELLRRSGRSPDQGRSWSSTYPDAQLL
ncbi:hypothetical protein ACQ4PT_020096 [Festuca glaucescens]